MYKRLLLILVLIPLLLVACTEASPDVQPKADEEDTALAGDAPPVVEPVEPDPTATTITPKAVGPEMECTLVSDLPEAPAELVEIFGVKENDWVQGPDTAAVTFVEYSDFQ